MTRPTTEDELTDVTNLNEWETRSDQSTAIPGSGPAPIREFSCIGSWADGETTDISIPLDQIFSVPGNKVFTAKVYDLTDENLAAIIALRDAGTTLQKIWTFFDDRVTGGNAGTDGSMRADLVVPEGRTDPPYGQFTFTTKNSLNSVDLTPFPIL